MSEDRDREEFAKALLIAGVNAAGDHIRGVKVFMEAQITRYLERTDEIVRESRSAARFAAIAAAVSASATLLMAVVEILRLALGR